jgi:hypothetical protein
MPVVAAGRACASGRTHTIDKKSPAAAGLPRIVFIAASSKLPRRGRQR